MSGDWTSDEELFERLVKEVARIVANARLGDDPETSARIVMAQLAHVHGLRPSIQAPETPSTCSHNGPTSKFYGGQSSNAGRVEWCTVCGAVRYEHYVGGKFEWRDWARPSWCGVGDE